MFESRYARNMAEGSSEGQSNSSSLGSGVTIGESNITRRKFLQKTGELAKGAAAGAALGTTGFAAEDVAVEKEGLIKGLFKKFFNRRTEGKILQQQTSKKAVPTMVPPADIVKDLGVDPNEAGAQAYIQSGYSEMSRQASDLHQGTTPKTTPQPAPESAASMTAQGKANLNKGIPSGESEPIPPVATPSKEDLEP